MFDALNFLKLHAQWLLRVALASVLIYHGIKKVMDIDTFSHMTGLPTAVAALVPLAELARGRWNYRRGIVY